MPLNCDAERLLKFLKAYADCEEIAQGEFVADFYDAQPPMTLNLILKDGKALLEAAAKLEYDPVEDGWYMGERLADAGVAERVLLNALEA